MARSTRKIRKRVSNNRRASSRRRISKGRKKTRRRISNGRKKTHRDTIRRRINRKTTKKNTRRSRKNTRRKNTRRKNTRRRRTYNRKVLSRDILRGGAEPADDINVAFKGVIRGIKGSDGPSSLIGQGTGDVVKLFTDNNIKDLSNVNIEADDHDSLKWAAHQAGTSFLTLLKNGLKDDNDEDLLSELTYLAEDMPHWKPGGTQHPSILNKVDADKFIPAISKSVEEIIATMHGAGNGTPEESKESEKLTIEIKLDDNKKYGTVENLEKIIVKLQDTLDEDEKPDSNKNKWSISGLLKDPPGDGEKIHELKRKLYYIYQMKIEKHKSVLTPEILNIMKDASDLSCSIARDIRGGAAEPAPEPAAEPAAPEPDGEIERDFEVDDPVRLIELEDSINGKLAVVREKIGDDKYKVTMIEMYAEDPKWKWEGDERILEWKNMMPLAEEGDALREDKVAVQEIRIKLLKAVSKYPNLQEAVKTTERVVKKLQSALGEDANDGADPAQQQAQPAALEENANDGADPAQQQAQPAAAPAAAPAPAPAGAGGNDDIEENINYDTDYESFEEDSAEED